MLAPCFQGANTKSRVPKLCLGTPGLACNLGIVVQYRHPSSVSWFQYAKFPSEDCHVLGLGYEKLVSFSSCKITLPHAAQLWMNTVMIVSIKKIPVRSGKNSSLEHI